MKKIILALIALAFAFAISSCCDQNHCPSNMQCNEQGGNQDETPYRWDSQNRSQRGQERQNRRW